MDETSPKPFVFVLMPCPLALQVKGHGICRVLLLLPLSVESVCESIA